MDDSERHAARREAAVADLHRVRGDFLASMIDVEAHVDRAIVYFFAPDELRLFIDTVLDRLNFASKIVALRKMLRQLQLDAKHRALLVELDALRVERNRFAHLGFDLVWNSYMTDGADYELYRKERLDPGPRVEEIIRLSDLRELVKRAREAERQAFLLEREITETHDPPDEYFYRPGWDPHSRFTPPKADPSTL